MFYCPGENCKKRETCRHHFTPGVVQLLDLSRTGSAAYGQDTNGNFYSDKTYDCGDLGNYKSYVGMQHNNKTCGDCANFIGGGDWNLCCKDPPKDQISWVGHLCYAEDPACFNFKEKDE